MGTQTTLGFIGAGKLAGSVIRGLLRSEQWKPEQITASQPIDELRAELERETGIKVYADNLSVVQIRRHDSARRETLGRAPGAGGNGARISRQTRHLARRRDPPAEHGSDRLRAFPARDDEYAFRHLPRRDRPRARRAQHRCGPRNSRSKSSARSASSPW